MYQKDILKLTDLYPDWIKNGKDNAKINYVL